MLILNLMPTTNFKQVGTEAGKDRESNYFRFWFVIGYERGVLERLGCSLARTG